LTSWVARVGQDAIDEQLIDQLAHRARAGGLQLAGECGLLQALTKRLMESALEGEITDHLGYDRHDPAGRDGGNSRNGHRMQTVLTDVGPVGIDVARDRDAGFEPKIGAKRQNRLSGVDELVISLSVKGLTTREVQAHLAEVYGAEVSRQMISMLTDKVLDGMAEWQNRPLDPVYPVLFIDAIHVKIRDGKVADRPIYVALAVTCEGHRDILGLWAGGEGAEHWLHVLTELKNRGVNDVLMVVCDGLTGLPEGDQQRVAADGHPRSAWCTCWATASATPGASTGTPSPKRCARSAPHPPKPRRWNGSTSSPKPGAPGGRRSCGCGRPRGPSSCRSWSSTPRSARSSARRMKSSSPALVSGWSARLPVADEDFVGSFGLLDAAVSAAALLVVVSPTRVPKLRRRDGAPAASSSLRCLWATSPGRAKA
jgi:hypothetical protein